MNLTRHASGLGTPHFMAPEQFADARSVNARSDLYSLAATLYNLLTGKLPFDAKVPIAILAKKESINLPPVRSIVPGTSERVDVAIRAALDPEPDRRPASCLEFFKLLTARRMVAEDVISTPAPLPRPLEGDDRRTYARYPLKLGSSAAVDPGVHRGEAEEMWPLLIRDVSSGGIGLLLARRFEAGTELSVSLTVGRGEAPQGVDVRVVRVQPERAGHWIHGCAFTRPLDAGQLRALLKFA
jgi:serine/threonine protein kinase